MQDWKKLLYIVCIKENCVSMVNIIDMQGRGFFLWMMVEFNKDGGFFISNSIGLKVDNSMHIWEWPN